MAKSKERKLGDLILFGLAGLSAAAALTVAVCGDVYKMRSKTVDNVRNIAGKAPQQYKKKLPHLHTKNFGEQPYYVSGTWQQCDELRDKIIAIPKAYLACGHKLSSDDYYHFLDEVDLNKNRIIEPFEVEDRFYIPTEDTKKLLDCVKKRQLMKDPMPKYVPGPGKLSKAKKGNADWF